MARTCSPVEVRVVAEWADLQVVDYHRLLVREKNRVKTSVAINLVVLDLVLVAPLVARPWRALRLAARPSRADWENR